MTSRRIAIIGAGTIGAGIAINAAQNGVQVTLIDIADGAAERAKLRAADVFARLVATRRMKDRDRATALSRLTLGNSVVEAAKADLVIEAIYEDFAAKAALYDVVSRVVRPDAIIATTTSGLRVSRLAERVQNPERFLGLHYFSPAEINPVCEVVRCAATSDDTFERADAFLTITRRTVLPCRDTPGFALNRFFCPYTNEAVLMWSEGIATPAEIDRAAEDALGAAAGPFRVMNIVKPRRHLDAFRNLEELGAFFVPVPKLVEIGEGGGPFPIEPLTEIPEPQRLALIGARLRAAVYLAVLQELDEGIADARTLDAGAKLAFKFSDPPCAAMDALGRDAVGRLIAPLLRRYDLSAPNALGPVGELLARPSAAGRA